MALVVADRVKTTTSTGTGAITPGVQNPTAPFRLFCHADTTYYAIIDDSNSLLRLV